jgi:hypothetical protein
MTRSDRIARRQLLKAGLIVAGAPFCPEALFDRRAAAGDERPADDAPVCLSRRRLLYSGPLGQWITGSAVSCLAIRTQGNAPLIIRHSTTRSPSGQEACGGRPIIPGVGMASECAPLCTCRTLPKSRPKGNAMPASLPPLSSPPVGTGQPPRLLDQVAQAARQPACEPRGREPPV